MNFISASAAVSLRASEHISWPAKPPALLNVPDEKLKCARSSPPPLFFLALQIMSRAFFCNLLLSAVAKLPFHYLCIPSLLHHLRSDLTREKRVVKKIRIDWRMGWQGKMCRVWVPSLFELAVIVFIVTTNDWICINCDDGFEELVTSWSSHSKHFYGKKDFTCQ